MRVRYFCCVCGNDWMSHLEPVRDHGMCQVCDHIFHGVGPEPFVLTDEFREWLSERGYELLIAKLDARQ